MTSVSVSGRPAKRAPGRLRWWREVLYVLAFYSVYSFVRNRGVATDSVAEAYRNALDVIRLERQLGAFWEEAIQQRFLDWTGFIQFWNIFYGTAHFVVTVFALVYLYRRMAPRYPLWRNTLACTTGLALIGFAFYPLMPPRLLDPGFGFVDTLRDVGGLWSFESGAVAKVSNQYAAMPSLHFAWSTWCALVLLPAVRRPWLRALVVAYPGLTLFAIVVTANHYWLDAAGGAVTLGAGFLLGRTLTRALEARGRQPLPETIDAADGAELVPVGAAATAAGPEPAPVALDDAARATAGPVGAEAGSPPEAAEPVSTEPAATAVEPPAAGAQGGAESASDADRSPLAGAVGASPTPPAGDPATAATLEDGARPTAATASEAAVETTGSARTGSPAEATAAPAEPQGGVPIAPAATGTVRDPESDPERLPAGPQVGDPGAADTGPPAAVTEASAERGGVEPAGDGDRAEARRPGPEPAMERDPEPDAEGNGASRRHVTGDDAESGPAGGVGSNGATAPAATTAPAAAPAPPAPEG